MVFLFPFPLGVIFRVDPCPISHDLPSVPLDSPEVGSLTFQYEKIIAKASYVSVPSHLLVFLTWNLPDLPSVALVAPKLSVLPRPQNSLSVITNSLTYVFFF